VDIIKAKELRGYGSGASGPADRRQPETHSMGKNRHGRVTVVFRGNWAQATDIARTNVQGLELVEVA
jgi:hypothetical protein